MIGRRFIRMENKCPSFLLLVRVTLRHTVSNLKELTTLFAVTALFGIASCFSYYPMYGLVIAFKDYSPSLGFSGSPWVGFKHFSQFFHSYQFGLTIKNTLAISLYSIFIGFPLPIAIALLSNQLRSEKFKKVFQVTTYFPHFISVMVVVGMILIFFSPETGIVANLFRLLGLTFPNILANTSFSKTFMSGAMFGNTQVGIVSSTLQP